MRWRRSVIRSGRRTGSAGSRSFCKCTVAMSPLRPRPGTGLFLYSLPGCSPHLHRSVIIFVLLDISWILDMSRSSSKWLTKQAWELDLSTLAKRGGKTMRAPGRRKSRRQVVPCSAPQPRHNHPSSSCRQSREGTPCHRHEWAVHRNSVHAGPTSKCRNHFRFHRIHCGQQSGCSKHRCLIHVEVARPPDKLACGSIRLLRTYSLMHATKTARSWYVSSLVFCPLDVMRRRLKFFPFYKSKVTKFAINKISNHTYYLLLLPLTPAHGCTWAFILHHVW